MDHNRARVAVRMNGEGERALPRWTILEILVIGVAALFALWEASEGVKGDHAVSRLASVYSVTHYGNWYIDNPQGDTPNPFESQTIDKVMVRGHVADGVIRGGRMISSKPPILPLLMAGEYSLLHALFGWDLDHEADLRRTVFVMTLSLVGSAYVLTIIFFAKALTLLQIRPGVRLYLLVALAFGTQLWGFSGKLSNHVPATGLLMIAVYFSLGLASGSLSPKPWRFALFGLAGALTSTIDLPMAVFVALAGLPLLYQYPRQTIVWVGLSAGIPLAVHFALMIAVTGSPLPVQVRKETYLYENSYWRHPMGIDALSEPKARYLFHILFGRAGIFSLYPVLLSGMAGLLAAMRFRRYPWRAALLCGGIGFLFLLFYYVTRTNNYGGESYGFRWFIGAMPLLLLMGALPVNRLHRPWHWVFLGVLLAVSLYSGWECAQVDWESGREWTSRIFGRPHSPTS
jgi:hypothetical protein